MHLKKITLLLACLLLTPLYAATHIMQVKPRLIASHQQRRPAAIKELLLAVTLNQRNLNHVALVLVKHRHIYVSHQELALWRFKIPSKAFHYHNRRYYNLNRMPNLTYQINHQTMTLQVLAKARAFLRNVFQERYKKVIPTPASPGAFLNYDLMTQSTGKIRQSSGLFNGTVFNKEGSGSAQMLIDHTDNQTKVIRLNTTWTHDNPNTMHTWRLGDINSSTGIWGNSALLGGIQWGTKFTTQPNFIPYPMPTIQGEAALPSAVDLYLNNALLLRRNVTPGPFAINSIPVVTGAGHLQVVTKDLMGREQLSTVPYYVSDRLLRKGLHQYSIALGFTRIDYGIKSNDYRRLASVATDRYGFSNRFTGEWHSELLGDQQTVGMGGNYLVGNVGTLSTAISGSHNRPGRSGGLFILGFSRQTNRGVSFSVKSQWASRDFIQLGQAPNELAPKQQLSLFVGIPISQHNDLGLSYISQINRGEANQQLVSASYGTKLFKQWYLNLSALTNVSGQKNHAFFLTLSRSFGARTTVSVGLNQQNNSPSASFDISHSLPTDTGFGYQLHAKAAKVGDIQAGTSYQSRIGTYHATVEQQGNQSSYRLEADGGIAHIGGHSFLTRDINNSFALTEVPNYPNVEVYADSQPIGKTDRNGDIIIPELNPYQPHNIRIDGSAIPLDASVNSLQLKVIPTYRSGVILKFPIKYTSDAVFYLIQPSGKPVPAGAIVRITGQPHRYPVGFGGEVYATELTKRNQVYAYWSKHSCHATVLFPKLPHSLPDLGKKICRPSLPHPFGHT